jgi:hypothetical protein
MKQSLTLQYLVVAITLLNAVHPLFNDEGDIAYQYDSILRCDNDETVPCAASGRMTVKGWQMKSEITSVNSVCYQNPSYCKRPCGIYFHYFKLSAGFLISQNLLSPIFPQMNFTWAETYSLAHPQTLVKFNQALHVNHWLMLTVLRYPTNRIIAQYFATSESQQEYENFNKWVSFHSGKTPRRGNDGRYKFWIELDNVYTKVCVKGPSPPPTQQFIYFQNA